jgi:hypothetical protein
VMAACLEFPPKVLKRGERSAPAGFERGLDHARMGLVGASTLRTGLGTMNRDSPPPVGSRRSVSAIPWPRGGAALVPATSTAAFRESGTDGTMLDKLSQHAANPCDP